MNAHKSDALVSGNVQARLGAFTLQTGDFPPLEMTPQEDQLSFSQTYL